MALYTLTIKSGPSPSSLLATDELGRDSDTDYVYIGDGAANVLIAVPLTATGAALGTAASATAARTALGATAGVWGTTLIDATTASTANKIALRDADGDLEARQFNAGLFATTGGFYLGGTRAFGGDGTTTVFYSPAATTGSIQFNNNANTAPLARFLDNGNVAFASTGSFGGGVKCLFIANATTLPTTNPTGGGILYCSGGALVYRGSSGTVTTIAPP